MMVVEELGSVRSLGEGRHRLCRGVYGSLLGCVVGVYL
jgi:hypothetical protein